jgi:hypothetical protein
MGLYNFEDRFVPFILDGRKTHTIRAARRYPDQPGDVMHLYNRLRTKGARLLMRVPCIEVREILISQLHPPGIFIDECGLCRDEVEQLARADGFESWKDMAEFWRPRAMPFVGTINHWDFARRTT